MRHPWGSVEQGRCSINRATESCQSSCPIQDWLGGSWSDIWGPAFLDEAKWSSKIKGRKAYKYESESWVEQVGHRPCWSSAALASQVLFWGPVSGYVSFPCFKSYVEHSRHTQDIQVNSWHHLPENPWSGFQHPSEAALGTDVGQG